MVSYTTGADTGEKLIQNLSGLEDNVIYAEQKVTGTDGTTASYQDFLYTKDIQGSTTSILNKDTKGELSYEYDDFGETSIHGSSVLKNESCYTGGIYDESTGLYYLNARYYDPKNGRFLTEDTHRGEVNDPDTLHLYAYCANDPINYVDPSGHNKKRWNTFKDIEKESKKRGKKYKKARKCIKRYKKNVSAMSKTDHPVKTGYVYGQNAYLTIKFRKTNIADDGCGIVATHNAMHALGSKGIFNKLVTEFDYNMVLSGKTGIAYGTLRKCLAEHGYTTKRYLRVTSFDKNIKANQPGILETP